MDPLSGVLSLLKPRNIMSGGFDAGGAWSFAFPRHDGIKCYALASGQCWLAVEGVAAPVHLETGDCFLLPLGRPFRLASDLAVPSVDHAAMMAAPRRDGIATWNGGGEVAGVAGYFALAGHHAEILLGMLPPIVHIRDESDRSALRWSMERMMQELREPRPGGFVVVEHLAHMMLVQALRAHLATGLRGGVGWLFALADEPMGAAIHAMHDDPAYPWTLHELAGRVGMSRSTFALRFKQTVGSSPIEYLTRWRMLLAADRLATTGDPIVAIALSLGYESESAFSTAFKRVMGGSPRRYARSRNPVPAGPEVIEFAAGRPASPDPSP